MTTESHSQKITPFLWFDGNTEEAAEFYVSVFENSARSDRGGSRIKNTTRYNKESAEASGNAEGSLMTVKFEIDGQSFIGLNGGPQFRFNPSISFFINCGTEAEVDYFWEKFSKGGNVLMPLDKYDYSDKYGWIEDKYGVSWQIILSKPEGLPAKDLAQAGDWRPKIIPSLLFTNEKSGKAKEAIDFYISLFDNSEIGLVAPNEKPARQAGGPGAEGTTAFADFMLENQWFAAMDSPLEHDFGFNEAISFSVQCEDQEEIDYFWNKLTENGGQESMCGWLEDKFGISWQIVPKILPELLNNSNSEKAKRTTEALMQMKKLDIHKLKAA